MTDKKIQLRVELSEDEDNIIEKLKEIFNEKTKVKVIRKLVKLAKEKYL